MKTAEILLQYMDELQRIVSVIQRWVDTASEFFLKFKAWVETVIEYIERAIDLFVQSIGGRKTDLSLLTDDYLFV